MLRSLVGPTYGWQLPHACVYILELLFIDAFPWFLGAKIGNVGAAFGDLSDTSVIKGIGIFVMCIPL